MRSLPPNPTDRRLPSRSIRGRTLRRRRSDLLSLPIIIIILSFSIPSLPLSFFSSLLHRVVSCGLLFCLPFWFHGLVSSISKLQQYLSFPSLESGARFVAHSLLELGVTSCMVSDRSLVIVSNRWDRDWGLWWRMKKMLGRRTGVETPACVYMYAGGGDRWSSFAEWEWQRATYWFGKSRSGGGVQRHTQSGVCALWRILARRWERAHRRWLCELEIHFLLAYSLRRWQGAGSRASDTPFRLECIPSRFSLPVRVFRQTNGFSCEQVGQPRLWTTLKVFNSPNRAQCSFPSLQDKVYLVAEVWAPPFYAGHIRQQRWLKSFDCLNERNSAGVVKRIWDQEENSSLL